MRSRTSILLVAACAVAGFAGYGLYLARHKPEVLATPDAEPASSESASSEAAPAGLKFTDLEGKTHSLEDYRGKLLVVNFWATWCGPCLHEIPALIKIQSDYGARGFQIVGPAVDDLEDVRKAAPGFGFNYPVLVSSPEAMLDLMNTFGNTQGGLPFSVVIGPDGAIVQRQLGEFSAVELAGLIEDRLPQKK